MRVLILSCNTGEGHNSAGNALREVFGQAGISCEMRNFLDLFSHSVSRLISDGQVFLYRHIPKAFGWGYRLESDHPSKSLIKLCYSVTESLWTLIREGGYDTVICVHVFPALTLTEMLRRYHPDLATYFVSTDYTCHPFVSATALSTYFIPHQALAPEFTACGIPETKLLATGIPIYPTFEQKRPRDLVRAELGLPADRRIVLLSGGSIGCGPIRKLTAKLKRELPMGAMLAVICGTHTRLREQLAPYAARDRVQIIGYTRRMSDYMDAADLLLTKAGGLCTTEAIAKRLPLIYIDAVPGCETHNLRFGTQYGYALTADSVNALTELTCQCLKSPTALSTLSEKMCQMFPARSADAICRYVLSQAKWHDMAAVRR